MRPLLVIVAALVLAPAAFAHAEIEPASIRAGEPAAIHLTVPTEDQTSATVAVVVAPPAGVTLSGTTSWHGRTRGAVHLTFTARAAHGGDDALRVVQRYANGRIVTWTPVLHVAATENAGRDRLIILGVTVAAVLLVFALRRRR